MKSSPSPRDDHYNAIMNPVAAEVAMVDLIRLATELTRRFGSDHVLREGVASIIEGAFALCNGDFGRRLDMDQCRQALSIQAKVLGYNIDLEQFNRVIIDDEVFVR